jgi:hypothetical protein
VRLYGAYAVLQSRGQQQRCPKFEERVYKTFVNAAAVVEDVDSIRASSGAWRLGLKGARDGQ